MKKKRSQQKNIPTAASTDLPKRKITSRQVAAMIGIVLLVLMYLITLAAAITDSSASAGFFLASLFATVAVPLLIWIYVWMYGRLTGRSTIADPTPEQTNDAEDSFPAD